MIRLLSALFVVALLACGADKVRSVGLSTPTLWTPSAPDSAPPESEPAPFIIPGRSGPIDSAAAGGPARARELYRRGVELERQNLPAAAIVSYRTALRLDPTLREANYRMGMLFNTRAQWVEAAKAFAAEVEHHPDHHDAARELGLALAHAGDHALALRQLELLSRRRPRDGRVWHALGFAYFQSRRSREAETALRRAIALPPPDVEEHRDLGVVLASLGREKDARDQYRKALALAPADAAIWFNLGNLERRAGRADSALASYRRAVERDSSFSSAYEAQAQVLGELGREGEAVEVYRGWLASLPQDHAARLQAVELLGRLGLHDEALEWAEAGLRASPTSGTPHVVYGLALARRGRIAEALLQLREGQRAFGRQRDEVQRVERLIAALRAGAPDSLQGVFEADSLRAASLRAAADSTRAAASPSRSRP